MTALVVEGPDLPLHTLLPVSSHAGFAKDGAPIGVIMPGAAPCGISLLVRNHALDFGHVGLVKHHVFVELAFTLGSLGSQDMALVRVSAFDLARACLLEAFGRSAMCLQLRHSISLLQHKRANPASGDAFTAGHGGIENVKVSLTTDFHG